MQDDAIFIVLDAIRYAEKGFPFKIFSPNAFSMLIIPPLLEPIITPAESSEE
jgi:hypothetical protein